MPAVKIALATERILKLKDEPEDLSDVRVQPMMITRKPSVEVFQNMSRSRIEKFHKLFKSVPEDEDPIDYFSCAFLGDILLHGNLYVSENWFCFYSRIRGRGRLVEIPMDKVISITREKTALIIPNAIGLQTAKQKYVYGSFLSRDSTFKFLCTVWKKHQSNQSHSEQGSSLTVEFPFHSSLNQTVPDTPSPVEPLSDSFVSTPSSLEISVDPFKAESVQVNGNSLQPDYNICNNLSNAGLVKKPSHPPSKIENSTVNCHAYVHKENILQKKETVRWGHKLPYLQCFDIRRLFGALSSIGVKLQRIPKTNILIGFCCIMVMFLLLSAIGLMCKVLFLQAQLESRLVWSPHTKNLWRDRLFATIYSLQADNHLAAVKQIHSILQSNIEILQEVGHSLKDLASSTTGTLYCSEESNGA